MTTEGSLDDESRSSVMQEDDSSSVDESQTQTGSDDSDDDGGTDTHTSEDKESEPPPLHRHLLKIADAGHPTSEADSAEFRRLLGEFKSELETQDADGKTALHIAAELGLKDEADILIKSGADIAAQDEDEMQPLHLACQEGHTDLITLLLDGQASIEARSKSDATPLFSACWNGELASVELLLKRDAKVKVIDGEGWSPLHYASREGYESIVQRLLEADKSSMNMTEENENWTPLNVAIFFGNKEVVSRLLKAGAALDINDSAGWTPLMTATRKEHTEIITMLLEWPGVKERQLETTDETGRTPLHVASMEGFSEIASALIKAGANCRAKWRAQSLGPRIEARPGWEALHFAAFHNHYETVNHLLISHVNINARADDGKTGLHLASQRGNEEIVYTFLVQGVLVDAPDKAGITALFLATNAPADNKTPSGSDPVSEEHAPGDLTEQKSQGQELRSRRNPTVVQLLLRAGAKPLAKAKDGQTALHCAAVRGDREIFGLILEYIEADDLFRPDWEGSPVDSALKGVSPEAAIECLVDSGKMKAASFWQGDGKVRVIKAVVNRVKPELALRVIFQGQPITEANELQRSDNRNSINWAADDRLPDVLLKLIARSWRTGETGGWLDQALSSVLEPKGLQKVLDDESSCKWLSRVLWFLITASERTPENIKVVDKAFKSVQGIKPSVRKVAFRNLKPGQRKLPNSAVTNTQQTVGEGQKTEIESQRTTLPHTSEESTQTRYSDIIRDILKDPPFAQMSQTHRDQTKYSPPKPIAGDGDILSKFEATVVGFFSFFRGENKGRDKSGRIRRSRPIQEVIYGSGPDEIVRTAIDSLTNMTENNSELFDSSLYTRENFNFTWVHFPSTNMVWMNDMVTYIMSYERYRAREYFEVRSFFRDSWIEVPDKKSSSRTMRPRTVVRPEEKSGDLKPEKSRKKPQDGVPIPKDTGKPDGEVKKAEDGEARAENERDDTKPQAEHPDPKGEDKKPQDDGNSEKKQHSKKPHQFVPASAVYMPYLTYSTYCQDCSKLAGHQELKDATKDYDQLKDRYSDKNMHQHESPTLDEWYYQFADEQAASDRCDRNKSQVVSKYRGEGQNEHSKNGGKGKMIEPYTWTVVRVNQLWIWTISDKWIITATSSPFDDSPDILVEDVLTQLSKQADYGGSRSQPTSVADLVPVLIDYCIGSYERRRKHDESVSISQAFSHYINKIGRDETKLFDSFRFLTEDEISQTEVKDKKTKGPMVKGYHVAASESTSTTSTEDPKQSARLSDSDKMNQAIKKAKELYHEIKDVRDELNILKSITQFQQIVQRGLPGKQVDESSHSSTYVMKDLKELDFIAERLQSAINTTLSLQQSDIANRQATLATKQGKTVMAFTFATVLFLPLSFLSSLFALDVASFQAAPAWAFYVIFLVSIGISVLLVLIVFNWEKITKAKLRHWKGIFQDPKKADGTASSQRDSDKSNTAGTNLREIKRNLISEPENGRNRHRGILSRLSGNGGETEDSRHDSRSSVCLDV